MKLSVVATLYKSAPYVKEFYERSSAAAQKLVGDDYEVILVNDGSPDNSLELAVSLTKCDKRLTVIDLSRNFGHHKAMMTGLAHSVGERVFLIDSDLEEEPEFLLPFAAEMDTQSADVVYGVQERRKGGWFERVSGEFFYFFFNALTGLELPKNVVTARLMERPYVDALLLHREREVFMAGLWHTTGFFQHPFPIKKHSTSETTYTLQKKIYQLLNSITSFSNAPLVFIFNTGIIISLTSFIYIVYLVLMWLSSSKPLTGWTSVMASIWLIGGLTISFIGVIGIYLSKIFLEVKQRPYTLIRRIYGRS
jgi:putative glycosyltransferase